jgi:hypothetical protein
VPFGAIIMIMNRRMFAACIAAVALSTVVGLAVAPAWSQPRRTIKPEVELVVPPGRYSAIVFAAFGSSAATSYAGYIVVGGDGTGRQRESKASRELPVVVRGGETLVVPFAVAWTIEAGDRVRIAISPDAPTDALRVWGIAEKGPVAFQTEETRP